MQDVSLWVLLMVIGMNLGAIMSQIFIRKQIRNDLTEAVSSDEFLAMMQQYRTASSGEETIRWHNSLKEFLKKKIV